MNALFRTKATLWIIIVILIIILSFKFLTNLFSVDTDENENGKLDVNSFIIKMKDQMVLLDSTLRIKNQNSILKLDEVEIEANFVIKNKSSKNGEVKYEIVTVDSKSEYKNEQIQKITLHLGRNVRRGN